MPTVASLSSDGAAVLVVVPVGGAGDAGGTQLVVPVGQAVRHCGHTVCFSGQCVSIARHALTTGGHFVWMRGQNVSTVQTVGRGGHLVSESVQIVSRGGHLVSVSGHFVWSAGQNV